MLAIDLFCGLGGWSEALLAEGWHVVGFDNERHVYGDQRYPAQLVLQDVLTLHGSQFRNADLIVASPPCQEFSYMAMPWSRGKQIAAALRGQGEFPDGYEGSRTIPELTALFDACFRIQREASEAAGRYIPMVVENVKGAQPWVGRAKANYGSFYLWGDVESVGGRIVRAGAVRFGEPAVEAASRGMKRNPDGTGHPQGSWFAIADSVNRGQKTNRNFHQFEQTGIPNGRKVPGLNWSGSDKPGYVAKAFNDTAVARFGWRDTEMDRGTSKGDSRKAASAQIAKIPRPLAEHIARIYKPSATTTA